MSDILKGRLPLDLQRFAVAPNGGHPVANTGDYTNAYTGEHEAFDSQNTMSPQMKEWYNTEALENARKNHYFTQFAKKIPLPENHGITVEMRKPNTFKDVPELVEGVIPDGENFGYSAIQATVHEFGNYTPLGKRLTMHAIDPVAQDAAEEMGAAGGDKQDRIARDVAISGSNVMFAEKVTPATGEVPEVIVYPYYRGSLDANFTLKSDTVNRAATWLKKHRAPKINGKYVAIIHPSVSYDLRKDKDWIEAHKYAQPGEIYNGEIGELHGVRFIESDQAKVYRGKNLASDSRTLTVNGAVSSGATTITFDGGTVAEHALKGRLLLLGDNGEIPVEVSDNTATQITLKEAVASAVADNAKIYPGEGGKKGVAVYACVFLGKDAFGMIDVSGGNMRLIVKTAEQVGGPLEQYGTVGVKFETGGGVLYEERLLRVECGSFYSNVDEDTDPE